MQDSHVGGRRGPVIVAGYDASPEARAAFEVAVRRASPHGTVVAVYAIAPTPSHLGRPYYDRAVERARVAGCAVLADLPAMGGSLVETALLEGPPADVLARVARVRGAREIVVGTRKLGPIRRAVTSVSRRLLATADRPVVVVPAPRQA